MTNYRVDTSKLIKILKMKQMDLKEYLYQELRLYGYKPVYMDGFILAEGKIPVALVAHMDTVFAPPKYVEYKKGIMSSTTGLGADDRAGVYGILHLLKNGFRPTVIFTEDEEKGCVGASKLVKANPRLEVNYMIELDRQGADDCVFYDCNNIEFERYVEKFGFILSYGSFTDISELAPHYGVSAVNVSVGYYGQHSTREYLVISELAITLHRVSKMLASESTKFVYIPFIYSYKSNKFTKYYGGKFDEDDEDEVFYYGSGYKNYNEKKLDTTNYGEFVALRDCIIMRADGSMVEVNGGGDYYINVYDEVYDINHKYMDAYVCDYNFSYMTFADFV